MAPIGNSVSESTLNALATDPSKALLVQDMHELMRRWERRSGDERRRDQRERRGDGRQLDVGI